MKMINLKRISIFPMMLLVMTVSQANSHLTVGKKLTADELSKLKNNKELQLGDQTLKVLTEQNATEASASTRGNHVTSLSKTYVADANGVVGVSQNAVMISDVPVAQVRSKATQAIKSAIAVKYYDHLNITSLQFQSLNDAVAVQRELVKLFPSAKVSVPIQFSERKIR